MLIQHEILWQSIAEVSDMKIDGTGNNFFNYRTTNSSSNNTIETILNRKDDNPVQVTISESGKNHYRNSIQKGNEESDTLTAMIPKSAKMLEANLSADLEYHFQLGNELAKYKKTGIYTSFEEESENLLKSYAALYDNIVQGYADGTREIHVYDAESEEGYRVLTQEEEINVLNDAFNDYANALKEKVNQEPMMMKATESIINMWATIGKKPDLAKNLYEEFYLKRKAEVIPKNINNKLTAASVQFIKMYSQFGGNPVNISSILQNIKLSSITDDSSE